METRSRKNKHKQSPNYAEDADMIEDQNNQVSHNFLEDDDSS